MTWNSTSSALWRSGCGRYSIAQALDGVWRAWAMELGNNGLPVGRWTVLGITSSFDDAKRLANSHELSEG